MAPTYELPVLRGRQPENFASLREEVEAGRDPLLVAPCGYGKGTLITYIVFSALERARIGGYRVSIIFLVHGNSLVMDMHERLTRLGIPHGVLVGGKRRERHHSVQIASIDTVMRMEYPPHADLVIIDEAHMAVSPNWLKTIKRFASARKIGMTATPCRMDGKGLGRESGGLFDTMILGPSVIEMIEQGYLVRSRVLEAPTAGAAGLKKGSHGKIPDAAQAAVFDKVTLIGDEIKHYKDHASGRKGVTFGSTQQHAAHLAEQFTLAGITWAYVDANTPLGDPKFPVPGTRAHIYRDLDERNGNLMGISSVGCTATGWDHKIVSYLGIMRVSESFSLHHQIMGRGSRIDIVGGKQDFLIVDHAGNVERHRGPEPYHLGYFESPIEWSLNGEAVKPGDPKGPAMTSCKQSVMNCWCPRADKHTGAGDHLACHGTFKVGPPVCPYCGCPVLKKERKIEHVEGDLGERQRDIFAPVAPGPIHRPEVLKDAGTPTSRRRQLQYMLDKAKAEGKKPGWAKKIIEVKTGVPVPPDWMPKEWRDEHGY